ncbi:glycogen debranching N-terminal domain-containing protein [Brachybacterium tyrofermentans]|uniref:Glycogen debranching N-terminal domain-containing protein n=1 Tax=Brachybacterium tyrofermentans TaxID=47848 RepID=A0ABW0FJP8_9MICO|nr:glycogen debranching N-terminal domain-containing protein [Brachybacterium tyrofermentans]SLN00994.1 amylo-alpha-1,6-glucosidase [Corynebacterium xerosis]
MHESTSPGLHSEDAGRPTDGAASTALPPLDAQRPIPRHQPFVHDLVGVLRAPVQAWSRPDGAMLGAGAEGIYLGDTRVVSDLRCDARAADLSPLGVQVRAADEIVHRDVVSTADRAGDPLLTLERTRTAHADGFREQLRLVSDDDRPRRVVLRLALIADGMSMSAVKDHRLALAEGEARPAVTLEPGTARWPIGTEGGRARLTVGAGTVSRGPDEVLSADGPIVTWTVALEAPARGEALASWRLDLDDPSVPFEAASEPWAGAIAPSAAVTDPVASTDPAASIEPGTATAPTPESRAVDRLLRSSLSDLDALRLQVPGEPAQTFFAAGAPWFFTLFGRDALIAASLALPVDRSIAEGTLRTLARHQGTIVDVETAQQPGKILHEVRAQGMDMVETRLPPVYYGTIDATPLWIELLHDARRAGLDDAVLAELRPALEAASLWLLEHADADGDALLEYLDDSGHGLANQGWKDSGDSIRFADGSVATGAIAPAEVQGYAYAAARHAADLLEESDLLEEPDLLEESGPVEKSTLLEGSRDGSSTSLPGRLRAWAERLHARFHETFWCEDELGPFVALALDGEKHPVTGVASNMGHLLGTGILDAAQERQVVDRLLHLSLFSGFGIRTLSTTNGAYGPLRYHGGSVWTHDTGYILRGLLRAGFDAEAQVVARGLLRAADGFDQRLPELFGGTSGDDVDPPLPYPAACRPQAWAAASAVPVAQALGALPR